MSEKIPLYTHELDEEEKALVARALRLFNESQEVVSLVPSGTQVLPESSGRIDCAEFYSSEATTPQSITVTGRGLSDNWFSHTYSGRGLITVHDWRINFLNDRSQLPVGAPDASLLTSMTLSILLILSELDDLDVLHDETVGCLFDLCENKPDRAIKLRSAYICSPCLTALSEGGLSSIHIDAARAALEQARCLVLGREPQSFRPAVTPEDDGVSSAHSGEIAEIALPPRLVEACRVGRLTLIVGSGLSMQADVRVAYAEGLEWAGLPSWPEVIDRLAESVEKYTGRRIEPRQADSLSEFLADLDYFRSVLGEQLYYPRAIFDIFAPHIVQPGRASEFLFRLPVRWILSTNYDFVLQYAAPPGTPLFTWREARQAREYLEAGCGLRPILKLHGCASRPDTIVLTTIEYERLRQSEEYVSLLRFVFESQAILFVGFGMTDPFDLDIALQEAALAGAAEGEKFALIPTTRAEELRRRFPRLQLITYDDHSHVAGILAALIQATELE